MKDLQRAIDILDEDHFGLTKVKERIIEYLAVQAKAKKIKSPILCLVGAPGVGKTSLAINLAYEIYRETKEKVCVLDLSFNSEDVAVFLNIEQKFDIDYYKICKQSM